MEKKDFLSNRLNDEVILFFGCTIKELMAVVFISFSLSTVISMPVMLVLFGKITLGLVADILLSVLIFLILVVRFSKLKRGKPAGYYQQFIVIKFSKLGLIKNPYVMRSGAWSTVRVFEKVNKP